MITLFYKTTSINNLCNCRRKKQKKKKKTTKNKHKCTQEENTELNLASKKHRPTP